MAKHAGRSKRPAFSLAWALPLFVVGLIFIFIGHSSNLPNWMFSDLRLGRGGSLSDAVAALGDALIVAAILSLIVEPYVRLRLMGEFGRDLFWAIFSPNAPNEFKQSLQELSAPRVYWLTCYWAITLTWTDDTKTILTVDTEVEATGMCLDRHGYRPVGEAWVMATHDGSRPRYLHYRFKPHDPLAHSVDLGEEDLRMR